MQSSPEQASLGISGLTVLRSLRLYANRRNKEGQYVYYHCTGQRGKCVEKYVREEELAKQFAELP